MEVLAPVGAKEQLIAAVRSGADAVYLGTKDFNARKNADNFADGELCDAIKYAHERGVKVYVALNTVITDNEIKTAINTVKSVANAGADAVIVQDMAMYRIVKDTCPDMPLHASTQMSVHNAQGAKELQRLGFCRVVPARELSLDELRAIRDEVDIELEVFVHGALCMSVSGQCYMSSVLGQRSANRGLCAQPCRLDFKSRCGDHALSLKDLSAIDMLKELEAIGINSAKIEGRMKRPEYVAAATSACKAALLEKDYDKVGLRAVFSRSGFTNGYIEGKRTRDMFGYRTKDDVVSANPVLKSIANEYRNEMPLVPITIEASIKKDVAVKVTVCDGKNTVTVEGSTPQAAQNKPTDIDAVTRSMQKCGGTPFFATDITAEVDKELFVPASALNELRKEALSLLLQKRQQIKPRKVFDFSVPNFDILPAPKKQLLYARFESAEQVCDGFDKIILDYNKLYENKALCQKYAGRLVAELPTLMFSKGASRERLTELKNRGITEILATNIYAINIARDLGFDIIGAFSLNINNSLALDEYKSLGLKEAEISFECSLERFDALKKTIPCGIVVYGKMPLMTVRSCPVKTEKGCEGCDGRPTIIDRMNTEIPLVCKNKQYVQILNPQPIYMGDKLPQLKNAHFISFYFTDESKSECAKIAERVLKQKSFYGKFTRGLYYKEIK